MHPTVVRSVSCGETLRVNPAGRGLGFPPNSGGPLINTDGCVVGVINARLNDLATAKLTGSLPQNVNYAVKSAYVLPLLDSISEGSHLPIAKKIMTFEDAVKLAESATCIILAQ